jgi:hypothetical protein
MMVIIFSGHANASEQVRREVERAVHRGIPIAPIRIQDVTPKDDLEFFLSSSHWMDAITPPLAKHLREFSAKVRAMLELDGAPPLVARDFAAASVEAAPAAVVRGTSHRRGLRGAASRARLRFRAAPPRVRLLVFAIASATLTAAACLLLWLGLVAMYSAEIHGQTSHSHGQSTEETR